MTLSNSPLVTVGMPVYNAEATLARSILSVLEQSHTNLRLVLSDDASTDNSLQVCQLAAESDPRIVVQAHPENLGGIANFNSVIRSSETSDFFVWVSDHDVWHKDYLAVCVEELSRRPAAVLCYTLMREVSGDPSLSREIDARVDTRGLSMLPRVVIASWAVPANTGAVYGLMRVAALKQMRSYPNVYPLTLAPDVLFLIEMASIGEFIYVDRHLYELTDLGAGHATPERYLSRLHLHPRSGIQGGRTFFRLFPEVHRRIKAHSKSASQARIATLLATFSLLRHYRGLLPLLVAIGRTSARRARRARGR